MQRKYVVPGVVLVALVSLLIGFAQPASADAGTSQPLVLNDGTPSVDIVITPTGGAQGVVYLQLDGVHVQLLDSGKNEILSLIDKRVRSLAIQIAQGSVSETLHLERLPGVSSAQALISAQAAMPVVNLAAPVTANTVANTRPAGVNSSNTAPTNLNGPSTIKVVNAPASTVTFTTTSDADMLTAPLPTQEATVQLADTAGTVILTSITGPIINGLAVQLTPGQYAFSMTNRDLTIQSQTTLALSLGPTTTLAASNQAAPAMTNSGQPAANGSGCTATVKIPSANVRSGPGTAYSVLGAVALNNALPVGGTNREGGWLLVQTSAGPAWVSLATVAQSGSCGALRSFDIPIQNVVDQQPVVAQQSNPAPSNPAGGSTGSSGGSHEDHHGSHEDGGGSRGGDD